MAPNTNFKAVALFGCSAKDLELIGAPNVKQLITSEELTQQAAAPQQSQAGSAAAVDQPNIDSENYWEDPADADTLWHYHGVTADRMDARRGALARVLERMQQRKAFEQEAAASQFGADSMVQQLKQDAARRQHEHEAEAHDMLAQAALSEEDCTTTCYWDEAECECDTTGRAVSGRVALPECDSDVYWREAPCEEDGEEEHELTAEQMAQRHEAILRVQEACRLRSRLQEYASQQELFSANHIVQNLQWNAHSTVAPVGSAGAHHWDW
jgi:hypothetical protein